MDRSPTVVAVVAAGAISLALSLFAIGAAISSDEDDSSGAPAAATEPAVSPSAESGPAASPAPGSEAAGSEAPAGERVDIAIASFQFNGGEPVTVAVGTEVVWTNEDTMDHSVVFADDTIPPSEDLAQGDTYSFTFTEPGTYAYVCGIHPRMKATIVVEG